MGFSKKHQVDGESLEGKKWVIAGITMRAPLKSLSTKKVREDDGGNSNSGSTTPTSKGSRIPEVLPCPPPPRKRRPVTTCHYNGNNREFFTSPELDSLFSLLSKAN